MAAVAETTIRLHAFMAPDATIADVVCNVEYADGYADWYKQVRGLWRVRLVQETRRGVLEPCTASVQVRNPKTEPFRLGSPVRRLTYGRPVLLELVYSATDGTESLFWTNATKINCTVHLA